MSNILSLISYIIFPNEKYTWLFIIKAEMAEGVSGGGSCSGDGGDFFLVVQVAVVVVVVVFSDVSLLDHVEHCNQN